MDPAASLHHNVTVLCRYAIAHRPGLRHGAIVKHGHRLLSVSVIEVIMVASGRGGLLDPEVGLARTREGHIDEVMITDHKARTLDAQIRCLESSRYVLSSILPQSTGFSGEFCRHFFFVSCIPRGRPRIQKSKGGSLVRRATLWVSVSIKRVLCYWRKNLLPR